MNWPWSDKSILVGMNESQDDLLESFCQQLSEHL
jgi:hypothetical protein